MDFDTYVISLSHPSTLLKQLKLYGFQPQWFKGTNGHTLDPFTLRQNFTPLWKDFGPPSAHGIALSHLNLWKQFLKKKGDLLLVLEDDVVVTDDAHQQLKNALNQTPPDFDILYLGCFGCQSTTPIFTTLMSLCGLTKNNHPRKINELVIAPSLALATHAYVLSKKGAQKLVDQLEGKIHQHIDFCIQSLSSKNLLNTYVITPRIAFQTSTWNKPSSNVSNSHPLLLNYLLSNYQIDTMVRGNYLTTLSICRIGNFYVTLSTILLFIVGTILHLFGVTPLVATLFFTMISLPDITQTHSISLPHVLFHFAVFITPLLILKCNSQSNFVSNIVTSNFDAQNSNRI